MIYVRSNVGVINRLEFCTGAFRYWTYCSGRSTTYDLYGRLKGCKPTKKCPWELSLRCCATPRIFEPLGRLREIYRGALFRWSASFLIWESMVWKVHCKYFSLVNLTVCYTNIDQHVHVLNLLSTRTEMKREAKLKLRTQENDGFNSHFRIVEIFGAYHEKLFPKQLILIEKHK